MRGARNSRMLQFQRVAPAGTCPPLLENNAPPPERQQTSTTAARGTCHVPRVGLDKLRGRSESTLVLRKLRLTRPLPRHGIKPLCFFFALWPANQPSLDSCFNRSKKNFPESFALSGKGPEVAGSQAERGFGLLARLGAPASSISTLQSFHAFFVGKLMRTSVPFTSLQWGGTGSSARCFHGLPKLAILDAKPPPPNYREGTLSLRYRNRPFEAPKPHVEPGCAGSTASKYRVLCRVAVALG